METFVFAYTYIFTWLTTYLTKAPPFRVFIAAASFTHHASCTPLPKRLLLSVYLPVMNVLVSSVVDENPLTKVHAPACLRELLLDAQRTQFHE